MINVYNLNQESHVNEPNDYYCGRPSILSNPYTHLDLDKTIALFQCQDREEAIEKFDEYFDIMYGKNLEFTNKIDEIYNKYKNGEEIYLGCFCKPKACHCDIIKKKIEERFFKEKLSSFKKNHDTRRNEI